MLELMVAAEFQVFELYMADLLVAATALDYFVELDRDLMEFEDYYSELVVVLDFEAVEANYFELAVEKLEFEDLDQIGEAFAVGVSLVASVVHYN